MPLNSKYHILHTVNYRFTLNFFSLSDKSEFSKFRAYLICMYTNIAQCWIFYWYLLCICLINQLFISSQMWITSFFAFSCHYFKPFSLTLSNSFTLEEGRITPQKIKELLILFSPLVYWSCQHLAVCLNYTDSTSRNKYQISNIIV